MRDDTIERPNSGERHRLRDAIRRGIQLRAWDPDQSTPGHHPELSGAIGDQRLDPAVTGQPMLAGPRGPLAVAQSLQTSIGTHPNRVAILENRHRADV